MTNLHHNLLRLNELHRLTSNSGESPAATVQKVYPYLQPRLIPRRRSLASGRNAIEVALQSLDLICHLCATHCLNSNRDLVHSLTGAWPRVWNWLAFLHARCCENTWFDDVYRTRVLVIIPTVLGTLGVDEELRKAMTSTPGLITLITKMWIAEENEGFEAPGSGILCVRALNELLHPYERPENCLENVISVAGDSDTVARVALGRLEAVAAPKNPDCDTLFIHISLVYTISDARFPFSHHSFLCRNLIPIMVKILTFLVKQQPQSEAFPRCIMFCTGCLCDTLMLAKEPLRVCQMLDAGILPALLRAGGLMADLEPKFAARGLTLLSEGLYKFLSYHSVLRSVAKALRRVDRLQIGADIAGPLWEGFLVFKMTALDRLGAKKEFDEEHITTYKCQGPGCNHDDDSYDLMRCAGCLQMMYCRSQCQRQDWPLHKNWCKSTQKSMRDGITSRMSKSDNEFRMSLLLHDFEKNAESITNAIQDTYPTISPSLLVTLIDYTSSPPNIKIQTVNFLGPSETCIWRSVIQKAEESGGQLTIIMAVFETGRELGELFMTATEVPELLKRRRLSILGGDGCEPPLDQ